MGIYLPNMEMPETCKECIIGNSKNKTCYILGLPKRNLEVREDCPLIEVQSPHGRLGDLDELKSKFRHGEGDNDVDSAWISTIRLAITQAETIIEAEGET